MSVRLNDRFLKPFVAPRELESMSPMVAAAHALLHEHRGAGSDFLGWLSLPHDYDKTEFARIKSAAARIRSHSDVLLVIGIGGSYLGARAAIEFVHSPHYNLLKKPQILFVGNNLSGNQLHEVLALCEGKDVSVNVISKSGTTTEPALAFRAVRDYLGARYTKEQLREQIFVTTDRERGVLKQFADHEGYETFVVPDDIGGRYSVLTAVGLLPIAASGADLDLLMAGATQALRDLSEPELARNDCYRYAALRHILGCKGKAIEILAAYEPQLTMFAEWYKQLFGESEGKDGKGIFPAAVSFSTDLHSVGQFIQEGSRNLFETVITVGRTKHDITVPPDAENVDGLNFLSGAEMSWVNEQAAMGTVLAHTQGGVPNILLELDDMGEYTLGYLFYFFMKACAVSGYLLGVNPFDQPGVEAYKTNMFALLGKPGFEELGEQLRGQLKE